VIVTVNADGALTIVMKNVVVHVKMVVIQLVLADALVNVMAIAKVIVQETAIRHVKAVVKILAVAVVLILVLEVQNNTSKYWLSFLFWKKRISNKDRILQNTVNGSLLIVLVLFYCHCTCNEDCYGP
jgi:uncharacterized integral membrane protein